MLLRRVAAVLALAGVVGGVAAVLLGATHTRSPAARAAAGEPRTAAAAATPDDGPRAAAASAAAAPSPHALHAEIARRAQLRALREMAARTDEHVFPIRGRHDRGRYETNDFGGGRGHQGQDMFADCGTPLVAALGGVVKRASYDGAGGNYLVISGRDHRDYVYMHLAEAPAVHDGQLVRSGQPIGHVGATGNADGCHLHFELWTAPGWYAGGAPVDTAKLLAAWDAAT